MKDRRQNDPDAITLLIEDHRADVVFTDTSGRCEDKRRLNANIHCIEDGIDVSRFSAMHAPGNTRAARPRLGFHRAARDNVDDGLVEALADAWTGWDVCLGGSVDALATVRRRPNLHRIPLDDAEVPRFVAGLDVCILPCAAGASTRPVSDRQPAKRWLRASP